MLKNRTTLLIALALFIVSVAIYSRAAFFPFSVVDDGDYVSQNLHVTRGLTLDSLKWAITAFYAGNWHPLTWMSLMLDGQFFGASPAGYHLVNVALHALNASLLFLLFRSMTGAVWRSAFVAACFALHPLHVESVAWIAERKDVLSTLLLILTLYFYANYVKQSKNGYYILSLAAFSLGLMAKAMLVTVPAILIVLDVWPFRRIKIPFLQSGNIDELASCRSVDLKRALAEKIPFGVISLASSIVTVYAQKSNISNLAGLPLYSRITNALWSTLAYIGKMLVPIDLAIFYPMVAVPLWKAGFAAALLIVVLFLALRYRNRYPYILSGWLWYLITLLPVVGLVQVGRQAMADRYSYVPLIGLFALASWGGADLCRRFPAYKKALCLAAAGSLLLCALGTWRQLGYWRDNFSLIGHTLEVTKNNSFAHDCMGLVYDQLGNQDLAIAEYRKSLAIEAGNASVHYSLAILLDARNDEPQAIAEFSEALVLNPRFAEAHFSLGIVMDKTGRPADAEKEFYEAIGIEPANAKYHNNLGTLYARNGMLDAAIDQFSQTLRLNANDQKARQNLQTALRQRDLRSGEPGRRPR